MNNIIAKFLDTIYDGPISIKPESIFNSGTYDVWYEDEVIVRGYVHNNGDLTYTTWTVLYETFFKVYAYIPTNEDEIDSAIMNWVKMKCKSQGIPFDGILKNFKFGVSV